MFWFLNFVIDLFRLFWLHSRLIQTIGFGSDVHGTWNMHFGWTDSPFVRGRVLVPRVRLEVREFHCMGSRGVSMYGGRSLDLEGQYDPTTGLFTWESSCGFVKCTTVCVPPY